MSFVVVIVASLAVFFLLSSGKSPQSANAAASLVPLADAQPLGSVMVTVVDTGERFEIEASLSNGVITNATLYPQFNYIVFDLATGANETGVLSVSLPRALIDAKSPDLKSDAPFTVVVDNYEADYLENNSTESMREILILIPEGAIEATIVGTQVLPEFPTALLFVAAIIMIPIVISSRLFHRKA